jgi:hypothetical protein
VTGSSRELEARHGMQVTLTFTVAGFASGMGALALFTSTTSFPEALLLDGTWFLFGLMVAWGICNYIGIVEASASPAGYLVGGLMILVAPLVASFWVVLVSYFSIPALEIILPGSPALTGRVGFLVGMFAGAMCVASFVLVSVAAVGGKWDRRALVLLAASAVATGMIPTLAVLLLPGRDTSQWWPGVLHLVGETLFASAGGYCLSRTWAGATIARQDQNN